MKKTGNAHCKGPRFKRVGPNLYRDPVGRYYLLVKKSGKQFRRSLKTKDATLAKRRLREFLDRVGHLSTGATDGSVRFDEVSQRWLTSKRAELKASSAHRRATALKGLLPFFRGRPLRRIGVEDRTWDKAIGAHLEH